MNDFNHTLRDVSTNGTLTIDAAWRQGRGAFGGIVTGAFVRAFEQALVSVDDTPPTLSALRVQLRRPTPDAPLRIETQIARSGRYVTYLDGALKGQDATDIAVATGIATHATKAKASFCDGKMPSVPAWQDVDPWPRLDLMPPFTDFFEYRQCLGKMPFSGATSDVGLGGWVRFVDEQPTTLARLAALTDAWPLSIIVAADGPAPAASVEIDYHFWATPDPSTEWVLAYNQSTIAKRGYANQETSVWSTDGRLLATARQLTILLG